MYFRCIPWLSALLCVQWKLSLFFSLDPSIELFAWGQRWSRCYGKRKKRDWPNRELELELEREMEWKCRSVGRQQHTQPTAAAAAAESENWVKLSEKREAVSYRSPDTVQIGRVTGESSECTIHFHSIHAADQQQQQQRLTQPNNRRPIDDYGGLQSQSDPTHFSHWCTGSVVFLWLTVGGGRGLVFRKNMNRLFRLFLSVGLWKHNDGRQHIRADGHDRHRHTQHTETIASFYPSVNGKSSDLSSRLSSPCSSLFLFFGYGYPLYV